jgi:flagellar biosynthesis protein FlhB
MSEQGSKTEPGTPRQRRRARERGQVPRSVELVSVFMLFAGLLLLFLLEQYSGGHLVSFFHDTVGQAGELEISGENMPRITGLIVRALAYLLTPWLLCSVVVALLMNFLQVGMLFSTQPLNPDLGKLNPLKGFQKMFSMRAVVELVKNLLKLGLVGFVAGAIIVRQAAPALLTIIDMTPFNGIDLASAYGLKIVTFSCALLLVLAILDYIYQRFEFEKSIRMSKQEIKDEYKNMEGDPQVKRRIREMGRQIAMSRLMEKVMGADAVITNPTHYAVAIQYELEWPAPQVVAKGADYLAKRIIRVAEEQSIPVYQQPELARALYKVEPGSFVPASLFKAVAKILAHLSRYDDRLKRKLRGIRPSGASATQPAR